VLEPSERVVPAGTPILELGDPSQLEVAVDVRSDDGVRVRPGQRMLLEAWGGDEPLEARVRRVEPSAFVEISALGVEERRVPVVADLVSPAPVGDRYRVEARIVVWEEDDVLRVPVGALFRQEGAWHAYVVRDGRTAARAVQLGRRGATHGEVRGGLAAGDTVVLYPGDRVSEGTRVEAAVMEEERP
jgi:HlyD family secretion protein